MKAILLPLILMTAIHCFSQTSNVERTKQFSAQEKKKFNAVANKQLLSLSSNNFEVYYYRCNWNIDPAVRYISGSVTSYFKTTALTNKIIYDFTNQLTVDSVIYNNHQTTFSQHTNATLTINFPVVFGKGKKDSVSIYYHGVPPVSGDFTGGFTKTTHSGVPVIWTLSEPYGASGWWPCRNGLNDKADSMDIYITHPSQYKASSNGVLTGAVTNGSFITSHYKHRYPVASYLVAFAVTNYAIDSSVTIINNGQGSNQLLFIQHVYPEHLSSFVNSSTTLLNALKLYSNHFGIYPFIKEQYGQTEFGWGGGMEHQTNSFVTNSGTGLITHELGHQWFGDKVTCGSWQDIWLNEGFATWLADIFYTEKIDTVNHKNYVASDLAYVVSQPGGSVWVNDTTNVNRIFDSRLTYNKGAFLVRMLRWTLGDSLFFKGINNYLTDPKLAYGFARTKDLQRNLQQTSGQNLNYFFNQWFYGEGYPSFTVTWKDSSDHKIYLNVKQKTSVPASVKFFKVPLPVQLSNGRQTKSVTVTLWCMHNNQDFVIDGPGFPVKNVTIDPDNYLISSNNKVIKRKNLRPAEMPAVAKITVSPNPVNSIALVTIENLQGKIQLQLFNNTGTALWSKQLTIQERSAQIQIPFSTYINGNYRLLVTDANGQQHSLAIVK
ncbi:MAG TPA: M1 family metallopeptidase [Parafilimonas sp.]|nr:M1 family metallopeptidase [Parafilimonas sp.]